MSAKLADLIGIQVVGLHQGQRKYAPRQQAGHMTAADQIVRNIKKVLARGGRPHMTIAAILNRAGTTTGKGNTWTRSRVATLRNHNNIAVYREGERAERGEATLDEAAEALNVSPATIRRLIADGVLPASQHCKGAPYVILVADLRSADVVKVADARRKRSSRPPPSVNQSDLPFDFQ